MITLAALCLALWTVDGQKLEDLRTFQAPEEISEDEYLVNPYCMEFNEQGQLFVADRMNNRIHIWNADGTWKKAFGKQGEGPGELFLPMKIDARDGKLYVWCQNAQMSIFDYEGNFLNSFKFVGSQVRDFSALPNGNFFFSNRRMNGPNDIDELVVLVDPQGTVIKEVMSWKNTLFMAPIEGNNDTTIKAYGPDVEIQESGDGNYYLAYSDQPVLYKVNAEGDLLEKKRFDLPTETPTKEEEELYYSMSFPAGNGQRMGLKDLPNLKVDFSQQKAYFTQFTVMGDKAVFVLHPLGGTNGVGQGFWEGTYVVADMNTGKPIKRSTYKYPEDSQLLLRNGHVLGVIVNDEDGFDLRDMKLVGGRLTDN